MSCDVTSCPAACKTEQIPRAQGYTIRSIAQWILCLWRAGMEHHGTMYLTYGLRMPEVYSDTETLAPRHAARLQAGVFSESKTKLEDVHRLSEGTQQKPSTWGVQRHISESITGIQVEQSSNNLGGTDHYKSSPLIAQAV